MEFFWFETKTYPIPSHLDASRRSAKTVPLITKQPNEQREMATWIIDWVGENPRQNENIALEPRFFFLYFFAGVSTVSGRESYVCTRCSRNRASGRAHTHSHTNAITSIFMTSQWRRHCVSQLELVFAHGWVSLCVCERASEPSNRVSSECDENFSISKWRPTFFRNLCVWVLWWWENVLRTTNDASGDLGFLALWLHVWILHLTEIESLFPNQKKKEI